MSAIIDQAREQMNKSVEATKENFMGIRTGRANPALLNGIMVDYYGAPTPIKAVASIGVPEPRTLSVTPFDASQANAVEKAIRDSDLGVSPNRDGNVIRVTMPELTEERRKEYVKLAKNKAEEGKVAVRNIRRKAKESIDKSVKDGELGEDEGDRLQKELDKVTKQVTDSLDVLLEGKQKEIMEV
ncbi:MULTISPECIES: ribosome recycling factor [Gardnerella]|jgi:ribosome recycling factor|uniref:Ribosome-recycling factor n=3 Tax=Gardnerella TaxID=2701 RepID=A0A9X7FEN9_9BIFI|nr:MULTISPECIES: ribosome recycling factor [Gardnerella]ADB14637.1 ribosome recycling factor [Gardnerella vaginalis 409-05]APW18851.1 ribosome-recycling factor [Gardnerella vaginalis]EFH27288.1 ribosome recycling factor [Gardnerella vaginalis AMD]EFH72042.1 ribosome recycling factor [Gardnerella vaginalis 5-1]EIK78826.1 ribosome recycling factor [Gardnerella vaginalis 6420B]RFT29939.1 ribosome-recycling factor [Bifidobacteriaceae bacterium VN003]RFT36383.1 ribosome-recycling factor [Bifidoba